MRIAMWSGPRNLSTAMMYSFGARDDCAVWDEPFYAAYLVATAVDHPLRDDVVARYECDPHVVAKRCLEPIPHGKSVYYMKHMPHHMVDGFPLDWAASCVNVHLIRHPARVIASYQAKRKMITMQDIGYLEQVRVFEALGGSVLDSSDVRDAPGQMLQALCTQIGLEYDEAMLSWSAGGRSEDGIWAPHWYGVVHRSTGFAGAEPDLPDVDDRYFGLYQEALDAYEHMAAHKISR